MVYVDTSAFLAVLDADDRYHERAAVVWKESLDQGVRLVCSSYVMVETYALVQHRLGMEALRVFHEDVYPLLEVFWVDSSLHEAGMDAVLTAGRRCLSLVDCVSFSLMRRLGLKKAFAFDAHFSEQGFEVL
ncbi:MAG: PIN domain-containing protein [Firmicutes bacterium]|nr:PIN domain-containing protein [Bacillota bacterium]